jgi:hypothetical protein
VPDTARIKGAGIRPFLHWYGSTWGHDRLRRHAERVPADLQGLLDLRDPYLGILGSTWYPASVPHAILDALEADHPPAERDAIVRDGARVLIDATLSGVYKWLFETMMTPERYARNAGKLFSRYYEPGTLTKAELGSTAHLTQITDWGAHHPVLCDFILHTAHYVYGALGCKDLEVLRTACVRHGSADCRFETRWS